MARGRMISCSVSTDKRFNALSMEAALVFLMTVPHLDRDGLILADACIIAGQICPRREGITPIIADRILKEWIEQSMVIAYEGNDGTILFFTGFTKNQAGMRYEREPKSILPVPPGYKRTATGLEPLPAEPPALPANDNVPPTDGKLPTNGRHNDGKLPPEYARAEVELEVEENRKEGGDRAREPYQAQPSPGEYLPGVPLPRQRQAKCNADHIGRQRERLGLTPTQLTALTDTVLERMNATEIAALDTDIGNDEHKQAQETALALAGLGHKTPMGIGTVFDTWYTHDFRGEKGDPPTYRQIVGHAKDMPQKVKAHKSQAPKTSEQDRAVLLSRARMAREKIKTAQLTHMPIDPQWQQWIDAAKGVVQ